MNWYVTTNRRLVYDRTADVFELFCRSMGSDDLWYLLSQLPKPMGITLSLSFFSVDCTTQTNYIPTIQLDSLITLAIPVLPPPESSASAAPSHFHHAHDRRTHSTAPVGVPGVVQSSAMATLRGPVYHVYEFEAGLALQYGSCLPRGTLSAVLWR